MLLYKQIVKKLDVYQRDFIKTYISLINEGYEPDDIKTIFLFILAKPCSYQIRVIEFLNHSIMGQVFEKKL